jgi:hypothetical protein
VPFFLEVLKMRPMVLLASALFPFLLLASIQAGCSSDDNATTVLTPPDSGPITVPEAGPKPGPVTVIISGKGVVVSYDGTPQDGGPNGFVGGDGGAPLVDCPGNCIAPQGTTITAYPQVGTNFPDGGVNAPGYVFAGWTSADGGVLINPAASLTIGPVTGTPITANFILGPTGLDASVPLNEDGGGPTMPFPEAGPPPSDDSGSEDGGSEDSGGGDTSTASDSGDAG